MNPDEEEKNQPAQESDEDQVTDIQQTVESEPEEAEEPETPPSPSEQFKAKSDDDPVTWTASDYIHLEKNGLWYLIFALVVIGLITLDIFVIRAYTFSALVIVMAIALIVYSRRPPRTMQYALSGQQGLYVGEKLYSFADFKAFGLIQDGEHHSIMLIPTKRFSPGVSVYFPDEVGEKIVDILGARLPMRPLKLDAIDLIVRQLRL